MAVVVLIVSNLSGSTGTVGALSASWVRRRRRSASPAWCLLGRRRRVTPRPPAVRPSAAADEPDPSRPQPRTSRIAPIRLWHRPSGRSPDGHRGRLRAMPGVHIVTDSACDLTDQLVKEHGVIVVPLTIRFGAEEFEDRRQLTPAEFWERCRGKGDAARDRGPSPGAFQAAYQQAADEGAEAVLCLTISSKVSATYASAVTAADSFGAVPVRVVDTYSLTMGQGLLVIAAAEDAAAGAGLDELAAATEDRIARTRIYGVIGGLEHLQRGGRIGGAQAAARLAAQHQARDPAQGRRGGRGVQAADPGPGARPTSSTRSRPTPRSSASPWPTAPATTSPTSLARLERHRHRAPAAPRRARPGRRAPTPGPTRWASATSSRRPGATTACRVVSRRG